MFATALPVDVPPTGGRLVSVDGRTLPLVGTRLEADACAGRARVTLLQSFHNPYAEPLEVTYQVPLPADGAVSGYAFYLGEVRIVGRVERLADARQAFAEAVMQGRTAALLEQDRSSLFTQKVGNIPPGEEVVVELTIDQPLIWRDGRASEVSGADASRTPKPASLTSDALDPSGCRSRQSEGAGSGWEWRFPTVVAPRYLGSETPDAARVTVDVAAGEISAKVGLRLSIRDARTGRVSSPSHAVTDGDTVVLDGPDARLDRDVVVRWPVAAPEPGVVLDRGRREGDALAYGALTVVPPAVLQVPVPRDLIVLLDTSGSMGGAPLDQAKAVTTALIEGLDDTDRLELMEFSNEPRSWQRGAVFATPKAKADAIRWVGGLRASGGTEMRTGILAALNPLRAEAQRQVILVTDGLIGFESQVVKAIRDTLPAACRVHTLGIGSGVNRSLTGPSARAGAGIEVIVAPGEDAKPAAALLLARTRSPQVVDLVVSGSAVRGVAPRRLPDLFAGSPARLAVALEPHGGELVLHGRTATGPFERRITVPPTSAGTGQAGVVALYGREIVEDLELDRATGSYVDAEVEAHGLQFQIATRLTAFVATTTHVTVDPRAAQRRETMPHLLPHGMSAEGVGLRPVAAPAPMVLTREGVVGRAAAMAPGGAGGAMPPPPAAPSPVRSAPMEERARRVSAPPSLASASATTGAPAPQAPAAKAAPADGAAKDALSEARQEAPKGLLGRIADRLRGEPPAKAKKAEAPPPPPAEPAPAEVADLLFGSLDDEADAEEGGGITLKGRLVLRTADRLVIEVTLPFTLAWQPGERVVVTLADGTELEVLVLRDATTAAGTLGAGLTVRLAVALPATAGDPSHITLADGTMITL